MEEMAGAPRRDPRTGCVELVVVWYSDHGLDLRVRLRRLLQPYRDNTLQYADGKVGVARRQSPGSPDGLLRTDT